ncbi:MAG: flagellar biosynthetic protein FliR [Leptospiraceae bacterium]|nr:flagellar biosynthetic protein FliR [Leptospiraceae bacterium]MCB1199164.1 flagellar biosynthetic protein FliR [Leptospiraceae bacterium]
MDVFSSQLDIFVLVLARMLAIFSVAPGYSGETLSFFHRIGLSFLIAVILTPVIEPPEDFARLASTRYVMLVFEQVVIGVFIGFSLTLLFTAFMMAGEFFSLQMGFSISEVFDPMSQISLPLMGTLMNMVALLIFFLSNSHLYLIRAVAYSFEKVPFLPDGFLTSAAYQTGTLQFMVILSSSMFLIALKIAIPVMGTLLLISITLGMLGKAAPQMNALTMGYPLNLTIGILILGWSSPVIVEMMVAQFDIFFNHLDSVITKF